jgi:hypothetical protein
LGSKEAVESIDPLRLSASLGLWKEYHRSTTKEKESAVGEEDVLGVGCREGDRIVRPEEEE